MVCCLSILVVGLVIVASLLVGMHAGGVPVVALESGCSWIVPCRCSHPMALNLGVGNPDDDICKVGTKESGSRV